MSRLQRLSFVPALLLAAWGGWHLASRRAEEDRNSKVIARPLVLAKIQALGELHAARYAYENVFEQETSRSPAEWASYIPGADSLIHATTRNRALVSMDGTVEAGVDLRRAEQRVLPNGRLQIVLPHATVYEPQVHAKLQDVHRGVFWRDDNIALTALEGAKVRLRNAAVQGGLLSNAESEARKVVLGTLANAGVQNVEVTVASA